jgi:hypothetical protein
MGKNPKLPADRKAIFERAMREARGDQETALSIFEDLVEMHADLRAEALDFLFQLHSVCPWTGALDRLIGEKVDSLASMGFSHVQLERLCMTVDEPIKPQARFVAQVDPADASATVLDFLVRALAFQNSEDAWSFLLLNASQTLFQNATFVIHQLVATDSKDAAERAFEIASMIEPLPEGSQALGRLLIPALRHAVTLDQFLKYWSIARGHRLSPDKAIDELIKSNLPWQPSAETLAKWLTLAEGSNRRLILRWLRDTRNEPVAPEWYIRLIEVVLYGRDDFSNVDQLALMEDLREVVWRDGNIGFPGGGTIEMTVEILNRASMWNLDVSVVKSLLRAPIADEAATLYQSRKLRAIPAAGQCAAQASEELRKAIWSCAGKAGKRFILENWSDFEIELNEMRDALRDCYEGDFAAIAGSMNRYLKRVCFDLACDGAPTASPPASPELLLIARIELGTLALVLDPILKDEAISLLPWLEILAIDPRAPDGVPNWFLAGVPTLSQSSKPSASGLKAADSFLARSPIATGARGTSLWYAMQIPVQALPRFVSSSVSSDTAEQERRHALGVLLTQIGGPAAELTLQLAKIADSNGAVRARL